MRAQRIWLLILNITFNMVMGFILPVNTIFIHKNLHESLTTAGLALMAYSVLMMVGNAIGGVMFDRFSRRGTLYIGYLIAIVSLVFMSFHHVWPTYAFMLVILGFGMGLSYTAINAYTAFVAEQMVGDSRTIFNIMYLAANVGIAIGSTAVGFIFKLSIFFTFFIPVLLFLLCIIILIFRGSVLDQTNEEELERGSRQKYVSSDVEDPKIKIGASRFKFNLIIICLSIFVVWLGYSQWDSNISIYMIDNGFSTRQFGLVFTFNAVSLLIIQPIMNRVASRVFKLLKHQIFVGTIIMGLSFTLLPGAKTYAMYILSMLILTIGESIVFPTIPALLSKMSTNKNRGTFQSFYSIFGSLGRALGPYVGSLVITVMSFAHLFIAITIMMIVVAFAMESVNELD